MVHEVRLLGVRIAAPTIAVGDRSVPDTAIVITVMVEWCVICSDVSWNVSGVGLWLISCEILIEHSPVVVSRGSTGRAHVLWCVEAGVRCGRRSVVRSRIWIDPRILVVS